jgi:protein disulfide-isomerase A6
VSFVLTSTNTIIQSRSKSASDAKANREFIQKEAERAQKEWEDEQELRKKSGVVVLTEETWESSFLKEREPYFINFYEANCSACIELNREWEAVATALKGMAKVCKLNISEALKLESQIKLESYPSVRYYPAGSKKVDSYEEFKGVKKRFSIIEWAKGRLSEKKSTVELTELNKANYRTMCKESKSTCIIVFAENPAEVSAKIGELAAKHLKKPISFLVSKRGSEPGLEKQMGVGDVDDTVFMYCKLRKMLRLGSIDFAAIEDTIEEIANGNRNNFVRYSFEEELR